MVGPDDPVIARMQALIRRWETAANPQAIFLSCYRMMTSNMLAAIDRREFQDPAWVDVLLRHFADYYFVALEAYEQEPPEAPPVWQLAHDTTQDSKTLPIQNLLLGVNAHINYDLVLTLVDLLRSEWADLSAEQRAARYNDYCHVNAIIAGTIDEVQDQVLEPAMPAMELIDKLLGPFDELMISRLINQWRETVWQHACRLLEATADHERDQLLQQVEEEALELGRLISWENSRRSGLK